MDQTIYSSDPYTFIKHRAYEYYLNCWIPKLLGAFDAGTVVDGFAGAGIYSGGEPGSSPVVARTLLSHKRLATLKGRLRVLSLEKRADRTEELRRQMDRQEKHPKLAYRVHPPGMLRDELAALSRLAHHGDRRTPTLWILDPYGPADIPADTVEACMNSGPKDEVIVTFFSREMYQRRTVNSWQIGLDRHFGNESWRNALTMEHREGMEMLVDQYCKTWQDKGFHAGRFSVRVHTEAARYYLVLLTHSPSGLECWTKMVRRMDPYLGEGASPHTADAGTLFDNHPSTAKMRTILDAFGGEEKSWDELRLAAWQENQSEKVLRATLSEMLLEGLAFRVQPLESSTAWPEGCTVRFYSAENLREANADQYED